MQAFRSDNPAAAFDEEETAAPTGSDRELAIIAAAKQNPHAFAPLYRHHVGLVYHYALGRLRDPRRAEDATSQTFTRVLQAWPSFNPESLPMVNVGRGSPCFRHRHWMPNAGFKPALSCPI